MNRLRHEVIDAIRLERERLAPLRALATYVVDTSGMRVHDLRRRITAMMRSEGSAAARMQVRILSFGFKFGVPRDADLVFDVRFLPNPHWVDVSRDGSRLYAANHESNVISVIDTATDRVLTTVPVGKSPHSVLAHPDLPYVYNVNYDDNTLTVTDTTRDAVVATVPTGTHPQDVSLAADGRHGYVAAVDADTIQVFDTATNQVTATVPTGQRPTSVAMAPDGRHAYVTNLRDGTVSILDVAAR